MFVGQEERVGFVSGAFDCTNSLALGRRWIRHLRRTAIAAAVAALICASLAGLETGDGFAIVPRLYVRARFGAFLVQRSTSIAFSEGIIEYRAIPGN